MKRKWHVRRQTQESPDGARRWDRAYLYLLEWAMPDQNAHPPAPPQAQEASDANSSVRPCVDEQPSPSPND